MDFSQDKKAYITVKSFCDGNHQLCLRDPITNCEIRVSSISPLSKLLHERSVELLDLLVQKSKMEFQNGDSAKS